MENEILNLINQSSNILIVTHVNPDGDTLGSSSALKVYIKDILGKNADILIQIKDRSNFPSTYSFLPYLEDAITLSELKENYYDLIITPDIASIDRIIDNAGVIYKNTENTISIDHHKTNKGYAKLNYIKGGISSTGEVLYELFKKQNIEITPKMAIGLYSAILTDTGCFKYESTTPRTFEIAKELSQKGINTSQIADLCYTNKPKNMILFQNYLVSNAIFKQDDKIAYCLITKDIINKFDAKDEYTEGIVETLRSVKNVEIALVLKETNSTTKVSIRTKEKDASIIASKFRGGGHKRASGCTIKANINIALEKILKEAQLLLL